MITGELKSKIDSVWNDFWSGGISNPLEIMEQLTFLLFIKGLDERQTLAERKAHRTGKPIEDIVFPSGKFTPDGAAAGRPYEDLRWNRFKNFEPKDMFVVVSRYVFPFLQDRATDSTHASHMKDARLTIPTAALLQKAVDGLDLIPMEDRDTKGDVYEYMLAKIATAGQNGQFRTPRHIIQLMVEMTAPVPGDKICDPASGTCGFLVSAAEHVRNNYAKELLEPKVLAQFNDQMFHGYDFDNTMLRIGSMNLQLHGIANPAIAYRDSLAQDNADDIEAYSLILANPPFAGSLDYESTAKDLLQVVKTKKTELLFLALFLRLLKPGGRAAVIVPDGVLFGSSKAHKELRRMLVEDQKLDGIVSLPSGVFKPYAGVSTAILFFTKTNSGGTGDVWFYDLKSDGRSLDDKRTQLLSDDKAGVLATLTPEEHAKNNLPDVLARWRERDGAERKRARTDQSFCVPKADIAANDYDLSINRYKEIVHEEIEYESPQAILDDLAVLESEIQQGIQDLKAMLR
jgi:type I restriction enzyme M protein